MSSNSLICGTCIHPFVLWSTFSTMQCSIGSYYSDSTLFDLLRPHGSPTLHVHDADDDVVVCDLIISKGGLRVMDYRFLVGLPS